MIGEFAFTPSVFDEEANPDAESWRDHLRELGLAMFPKTAACPVMVANLHSGNWHNIAMDAAKAIQESKSRILCQGLLEKIDKILVHRPFIAGWPETDLAWGREALASHEVEPLERIVTCLRVRDTLAQEKKQVWCIDQVQTDGFWKDISSQWNQPLNIELQIEAIRKLTLHSEFICLISPHIRGADDETDFAVEFIRSAMKRPDKFPSVDVEIHTEGPDKPNSNDFKDRLQRSVSNTTTSLRSALNAGQSIRLVVWPKLLDRYLIAGVYTETSNGTRTRSPRWGITMSHIARRADERGNQSQTSWSLMPSRQLGDVFGLYCSTTTTSLSVSNVQCP